MMDLSNGWLETINYPVIDHHQQTYVTKHDLNLLHKKIIATDLIVQKYQDANKALLRLQGENDDLKQQIEQITNECCIFGKQVTECTQECDHLKEQIDLVNSEKRELHQQLRLLQDENTNNYHEIMVLRQYESLKETNDLLSKTIERQQKQLGKLQLQIQRKSPIVYKPNKDKNEPSETDIALKNSQKSVRELKLALARLMNFIQISKIEIPTSLHIRPVLKAHEINNDFLEIEGEYVLKPVKKKSKPVISQKDNDDDDDDDHGDFIDIVHAPVQPEPVNIPNPTVNVIETTLKSSSRQKTKNKELPKAKETKKSSIKGRRKKNVSISEDPSAKLDDLANELDVALSQTSQQPESQISTQLTSFFSDDDDEYKIHKSNVQSSTLSTQKLRSTITIMGKPANTLSTDLSFFSEDDNDEHVPDKLSQTSTISISTKSTLAVDSITPMDVKMSKNPINYMSFLSEDDNDEHLHDTLSQSSTVPMSTKSTLKVDSITSMDVETSNAPVNSISFLSEDDEDNRSFTSISTPVNQKYVSPLVLNPPNSVNDSVNNNIQPLDTQITIDTLATDMVQEISSSHQQVEKTCENNSSFNDNRIQTESSVIVNNLDLKRIEITSRLLSILTHHPIPLKRLELIHHRRRHRIQEEKIQKPQILVLENNQSNDIHDDTTNELSAPEPMQHEQQPVEENNKIINEEQEIQVPVSMKEQSIDHQEINTENNLMSIDEVNITSKEKEEEEEHPTPMKEKDLSSSHIPINEIVNSTEQQQIEIYQEPSIVIIEITKEQVCVTQETTEKQNPILNEIHQNTIIDEIQQFSVVDEMQQKTTIDETEPNIFEHNQSLITNKNSSKKPLSQEYELINEPIEIQSTSTSENVPVQPVPQPVSKQCKSSLTSFQITVVTRLLNVLTNLPVKPLVLPMSYPSQKTKRNIVVKNSSINSTDLKSRSSHRIQTTRSINSIRTCIARCNQPKTVNRKRTIAESISSLPAIPKRMKSARIEHNNNSAEYNLIHKFINSSSKEINDDLKNFLQQKLHEDLLLFNDHIYRIFSDLMFSKCDIILRLVNQLHSYEESIKILLTYISNQSSIIQQYFIAKLRQAFEFEIKQQSIVNNRIKILNRLYFITCSIFATSPIAIYARLFDIGYYLSQDILMDALRFTWKICSSLISIDSQNNCSNILLHKIFSDILRSNQFNISLEYVNDLLNTYDRNKHDDEDLIGSFLLMSRHQTWAWCSTELCSKLLLPLLNNIDDRNQQRIVILMILQHILFIYKDDYDFKRDINFHDQIKQLLQSLNSMNSFETIVRDKVFSILHTCY